MQQIRPTWEEPCEKGLKALFVFSEGSWGPFGRGCRDSWEVHEMHHLDDDGLHILPALWQMIQSRVHAQVGIHGYLLAPW